MKGRWREPGLWRARNEQGGQPSASTDNTDKSDLTEFSGMDCGPKAMPSSRKSAAHMALVNAVAYGPAEDPATIVFRVIDRS